MPPSLGSLEYYPGVRARLYPGFPLICFASFEPEPYLIRDLIKVGAQGGKTLPGSSCIASDAVSPFSYRRMKVNPSATFVSGLPLPGEGSSGVELLEFSGKS